MALAFVGPLPVVLAQEADDSGADRACGLPGRALFGGRLPGQGRAAERHGFAFRSPLSEIGNVARTRTGAVGGGRRVSRRVG
jgi:hypothetical protein